MKLSTNLTCSQNIYQSQCWTERISHRKYYGDAKDHEVNGILLFRMVTLLHTLDDTVYPMNR